MQTLREKRMYIKEEKCKTCECENREECTLKKNNVKYELENCIFNFVSSGDELKNRRNRIKNRARRVRIKSLYMMSKYGNI